MQHITAYKNDCAQIMFCENYIQRTLYYKPEKNFVLSQICSLE